MFDREHPGPGCRVVGNDGSASYARRSGIIVGRHMKNRAMVWVKWDDQGVDDYDEAVVISLLQDEGVLDQLARIPDGQ